MSNLNKEQIKELLPHREPMLLIDELKNIKPSKKQKAELLDKVVLYFVLHLQQFKPPKSTEILNEIFKTP